MTRLSLGSYLRRVLDCRSIGAWLGCSCSTRKCQAVAGPTAAITRVAAPFSLVSLCRPHGEEGEVGGRVSLVSTTNRKRHQHHQRGLHHNDGLVCDRPAPRCGALCTQKTTREGPEPLGEDILPRFVVVVDAGPANEGAGGRARGDFLHALVLCVGVVVLAL